MSEPVRDEVGTERPGRSPAPGSGHPFPDADHAVRAVFGMLGDLTGVRSWYLVAAHGLPVVLHVDDPVFAPVATDVWAWPELLDPRVPTTAEPVIRHADPGTEGSPALLVALTVRDGDGVPYARMCGVAPDPLSAFPRVGDPDPRLLATLRDHARVVASLLAAEGRGARAQIDALLDPLTRLANRKAWEQLLEREEARCRRHDHPAGVLVVDVDGLTALNRANGLAAGDDLLIRAATVLLRSSRGTDVVARLSGDRFAILASGASEGQMSALGARLRLRLAAARAPASVGWASRRGHRDLEETWRAADRDMLRSKQSPGRRRAAHPLS